MKNIFVEDVRNVKLFKAAMDGLVSAPEDAPRMGLFFSEPGYGKTRTLANYVAHRGGCVVRAKALMTGSWFMDELVRELGAIPMHRIKDMFRQAAELMMEKRTPVFVDDVDHLCHDRRLIENLRDLHDVTRVPVVFIGMAQADKLFMRYRQVYDRFGDTVVKFGPLTKDEVKRTLKAVCEVPVSDDALDLLTERIGGKMRLLLHREVRRIERIAKASGLSEVTAKDIR